MSRATHKYQVGRPHELSAIDPWYNDELDAIEAATKLHYERVPHGYDPVGIWNERSQWVYLFFDGEMFRKV